MKITLQRNLLIATAVICGSSAWAENEGACETSANATLASEYVFRGQSQTMEEEAVQGGFDLGCGAFSFGVWGSNVDFGDDATAEIDYYAGYSFDLNSDLSLDLSYIYYTYPGEYDFNYHEGMVALGWNDLSVGVNYSPEYLGDGGEKFFYYFADYGYALPNDFSLGLHLALNQGDDQDIAFEGGIGEATYTEWSVGVNREFYGLDFSLSYWDTTIDDDKNDLGEARLVFSVSASF